MLAAINFIPAISVTTLGEVEGEGYDEEEKVDEKIHQ